MFEIGIGLLALFFVVLYRQMRRVVQDNEMRIIGNLRRLQAAREAGRPRYLHVTRNGTEVWRDTLGL
jgi:hypothetical protein